MPLIHGFSDEAISRNIAELIKSGKSPKQAKAIAEAEARKAKRQQMSDGGEAQSPLKANLLGLALQKAGFAGGGESPSGGNVDNFFRDSGSDAFQEGGGELFGRLVDPGGFLFKEQPQNTFQATAPGTDQASAQMQGAQAQQQQLYQQQGALAGQLAETAAGRGPSIADMQNKQATQRNIAAAQSMAASARGVNPALAARMAGDQAAKANQQAAADSMMGKLAEQRSAQEQLSNVYGQQQQGNLARQQMWGQQYGQNLQAQMGAQEINAQTAAGNVSAQRGLLGSIFGGLGAAEGGEIEPFMDTSLQPLSGDSPLESGSAAAPTYGPSDFGPKVDLDNLDQYDPDKASQMDTSLQPLSEMREPDADMAMAGKPQAIVAEATKPAPTSSSKSSIWPMLVKYLMGALMLKANRRTQIPRNYEAGGEVLQFAEGGDYDDVIEKQNQAGENMAIKAISSFGPVGAIIGGVLGMADAQQKGQFARGGAGQGGNVPGIAPIPGHTDTTANDVVPAVLSPGEIVLPRSVTKSPHPEERAAGFVLGVKSTRAHPLPTNPTPEDMARLQQRMMLPPHAEGGPVSEGLLPKTKVVMDEFHRTNEDFARFNRDQEMQAARASAQRAQTADSDTGRSLKADLVADERHAQVQQQEAMKKRLFASTLAGALRDANAAKAQAQSQPSMENAAKAVATQKAVDVLKPKGMMAVQGRAEGGEIDSGDDLMRALPGRPSLRKALMFPGGGPAPVWEGMKDDPSEDPETAGSAMRRGDFREAIQRAAPGASSSVMRALAHAYLGEPEQAQRAFREALEVDPDLTIDPMFYGEEADALAKSAKAAMPSAEDDVAWAERTAAKRPVRARNDRGPIQLHPLSTAGVEEGMDFLTKLMAEEDAGRKVGLTPSGTDYSSQASTLFGQPDPITIAANTPGQPPSPAGASGSTSVSLAAKARMPGGQGAPALETPMAEQPPEQAYHDANKDLVAAIRANANTAGKTALEQAALLEKGEAERRIRAQEFAAAQKVRQQQLDDLASDIRNTKVDPANLWNSKSTGQKVMASIGIMFGAMSQGLQGLKTNPVLDLIQKQIDNDIEAQKTNLHNKHSLFKDYLDLTGSEIAAEQYARSDLLASTAAQMQLVGLKMGNEQAQAGANYAIAELLKAQQSADAAAANALVEQRIKILKAASEAKLVDAQIAHMQDQSAQGWASVGIKASSARAKSAKAADDLTIDVFTHEKAPSGQGVTSVQPKVARDNIALRKIEKIQGDSERFASMLDEYIALADRNPHGGTPFSDDVAKMQELQPVLQFELSNSQGQGVIRREEAAKYERMVPDATSFRLGVRPEYTVALRQLRDSVKAGAARQIKPYLSRSGIPSSATSPTVSEAEEE